MNSKNSRLWLDLSVAFILVVLLIGGGMLIYQLNFDAMEVEVDNALAQRGQEISTQEGCIACHTVDGSLGVGPSWQGMIGRIETLDNGTSIVVDEVYFLESIRYAKRKMVDGYPNVMPSYMMEEEEIDALFAFASQLSQ
ncbi:MAG: c-type cytochrome [Gammaproteobacteria bacterium]|nr:c-type cytochrome [Gammaproteobacteria bacterium]